MSAPEVTVNFISGFAITGKKVFNAGNIRERILHTPIRDDSVFEVGGITIGVGFHWEQRQSQRFNGALELIPDGENIVVVNHIDVERYLRSVISSEMNAQSPLEFLKAHAVISRSWVLRQIYNRDNSISSDSSDMSDSSAKAGGCHEIIRWYDREDHTLFDVCADDHCQRYQGITRLTTDVAREAVDTTAGMVLTHDGDICDARFSKCCGGITEEFDTCWSDEKIPYLPAFRDTMPSENLPDLTEEDAARSWILSRPLSFCNTDDKKLLSTVLNNFDQTTDDFYRWRVTATAEELSELIKTKSGIDIGELTDLIPLKRGKSGRICLLEIVGTKRTVKVGKELEIRRLLSPSHLYSSAFVVEKSTKVGDDGKKITTFTLCGAGWGHGVGLCQIGAAAMGAQGYDYRAILTHYYPHASISKIYE